MKENENKPHHSREINCFVEAQDYDTLVTPNVENGRVIEERVKTKSALLRHSGFLFFMWEVGLSSSCRVSYHRSYKNRYEHTNLKNQGVHCNFLNKFK